MVKYSFSFRVVFEIYDQYFTLLLRGRTSIFEPFHSLKVTLGNFYITFRNICFINILSILL